MGDRVEQIAVNFTENSVNRASFFIKILRINGIAVLIQNINCACINAGRGYDGSVTQGMFSKQQAQKAEKIQLIAKTMKSQTKQYRYIRAGTGVTLIIGLTAALAQQAQADLVYGVSSGTGQLFSFNSASPGTLDSAVTLTGMANGEQISSIDYVSGVLYGLGDESHLYKINPGSGTCSLIGSGAFSPVLNGVDFGLTAGPGTFYVSSDLGQNLSLSIGGVATANPTYAGVSLNSLAYDPVNAFLYGISASSHDLYSLNPATGAATLIGSIGLSFSEVGLTISSSGDAYVAGDLGNQTALFSLNLTSGALTTIGDIGSTGDINDGLNAIAVTPITVPEPGFAGLAALGGGFLWLACRKRRFYH